MHVSAFHKAEHYTVMKWENTYVENYILNFSSFTWRTVLMICRFKQLVQWKTKSKFWLLIIATISKVTSVWNFDLRIFSVYGRGPGSNYDLVVYVPVKERTHFKETVF